MNNTRISGLKNIQNEKTQISLNLSLNRSFPEKNNAPISPTMLRI